LLPTVSDEEAKATYPGFRDVPSKIPCLRLVKVEDITSSQMAAHDSL
jgi:hypothetical protein